MTTVEQYLFQLLRGFIKWLETIEMMKNHVMIENLRKMENNRVLFIQFVTYLDGQIDGEGNMETIKLEQLMGQLDIKVSELELEDVEKLKRYMNAFVKVYRNKK